MFAADAGVEIGIVHVPVNVPQIAEVVGKVPRRGARVYGDEFFTSRGVQFATLAARYGIPASYPSREAIEAGGLMAYAADRPDMYRQIGAYTDQILKRAKPADLPVLQSTTKFEFVINLQTARALGIEVPNSIRLLADELIE
jgi:putative ABC transport system substrate-binding protein